MWSIYRWARWQFLTGCTYPTLGQAYTKVLFREVIFWWHLPSSNIILFWSVQGKQSKVQTTVMGKGVPKFWTTIALLQWLDMTRGEYSWILTALHFCNKWCTWKQLEFSMKKTQKTKPWIQQPLFHFSNAESQREWPGMVWQWNPWWHLWTSKLKREKQRCMGYWCIRNHRCAWELWHKQ